MSTLKKLRILFGKLCRAIPIDKNKCVFICFGGHSYADCPRAVSEALHELRPQTKIIWLFTAPKEKKGIAPGYVKRVRIHSPAGVYQLATADSWVINTLAPNYIYKRPGQFYVQTWHGDRGFKVCLHESGKGGLRDAGMIDVCVSGSAHADRFFKSAFQYSGEIMRVGSPRNDALMNPDLNEIAKIRARLNLKGERVLLYAPTMRDNRAELKIDIDFSSILDALEKRDGVKWLAHVRSHFMNRALYGLEDDSRIIDVSSYEDMRDLLLISDILVTDYSSSAGDFPLTSRSVVLYQRPEEEFTKGNRQLYFDVADSHFVVAKTQDELLSAILKSNTGSLNTDREILSFFGCFETGESSKRVAERVAIHMDGR